MADITNEMVQFVLQLYAKSPVCERKAFFRAKREELVEYHMTVGMKIRNHFKLWDRRWEPVIDEKGTDISPNHPDNLSMRVIEEAWEHIQAQKEFT